MADQLDEFVRALRAYADNEYCRGIGMAHRTDACLGWEAKAKAGKFGLAEYDAHEKMNRHLGAHYGIYEAIERALAQPRTSGVALPFTLLRDQDIEDVWQSVLKAMPDANEREQRIAFAKALQSAKAVEL